MIQRRPIVGVMGSGEHEFADLAEPVGRTIAAAGWHLLTGGGAGVMTAVARAFTAVPGRAGLSLGVIRAASAGHLGEAKTSRRYEGRGPNPWVEVPIFTHLPLSGAQGKHELSRNHINVLTATVVVVLPGGDGSASELELALEYGRPVVLFLGRETVGGATAGMLARRYGSALAVATTEADCARRLRDLVGT